ncbi:hypothetical protein R1flu_001098 [Riccia fluitans]|uniref:Uncharacterized protein n=1 Tax=Riccia fluitans TaxID=41844 RepID=A0ABD1Y2A1_9MARC
MPSLLLLLSRKAADHQQQSLCSDHQQKQKKNKYSFHMRHRFRSAAVDPCYRCCFEKYHRVIEEGKLKLLWFPTLLAGGVTPALIVDIMFRCRSVWARYISLALLLLLNSLFVTTGSAIQLRNAYIEEQNLELQVSKSDSLPFKLKDAGENVVPELFVHVREQSEFSSEAGISLEGGSTTGSRWGFEIGGNKYGYDGDSSRRNRRMLRGRPRPQGWSRFQRGRSTMEAAATPSQPLYLGPPAPSTIVHNEKQDWNQDYAEPDVHPPSSN